MIKKITIIGSGTMGNGIAHTFAQHGFEVYITDINEENLEKAITTISSNIDKQIKKEVLGLADKADILNRIKTTTNLQTAIEGAALVIEAATENPQIKFEIFKQLDNFCNKETVLATNTSSISITKLASVVSNPERVIGMHFMNPVPVMKLVEVIRGYATSNETANMVMNLAKQLQKVPVEVNDYPGFVANRILMPMINEAIYTLYEGVAGVSEIDTVMKLGMAHPMGPLQLADFIGLDVCLAILRVMFDGFGNPKYAPCPLLANMVAAGEIGKKSGVGFYNYSNQANGLVVSDNFLKN